MNAHIFQLGQRFVAGKLPVTRLLIGGLLILALFAFELFNFDTTRFALHSLFGRETFLGLSWAFILAVAFCAIDFAGLVRLFLPQARRGAAEDWYLMGAWLLGATLNAIMTWWAVSLTLLRQPLGNEVLDRQQLLLYVPIFIASLVWLTRLLFIGSLSIAADSLPPVANVEPRPHPVPAVRPRRDPVAATNPRPPHLGEAPSTEHKEHSEIKHG